MLSNDDLRDLLGRLDAAADDDKLGLDRRPTLQARTILYAHALTRLHLAAMTHTTVVDEIAADARCALYVQAVVAATDGQPDPFLGVAADHLTWVISLMHHAAIALEPENTDDLGTSPAAAATHRLIAVAAVLRALRESMHHGIVIDDELYLTGDANLIHTALKRIGDATVILTAMVGPTEPPSSETRR